MIGGEKYSMKNSGNNKEKTLPRFGVLDAVIILLVIAAVCGIYFRYNIMDMIEARRNIKEYTVEFSIDNINASTTRFIHENDEVRFASSNERLGVFIKDPNGMSDSVLSITPASEIFNRNGNIVEVFYPEDTRVDAIGRIKCNGTYSDNGIFLVNGSVSLSSGEVIEVHTDEVTVSIKILGIAVVE